MMNLNPYATEFNPVPAQQNNTYNNRYNNNQPSEPTHVS